MKLKVNDSGLPVKTLSTSPLSRKSRTTPLSPMPAPTDDDSSLSKGITLLWSLLILFLNTILIMVAISLTLCDIVDLESHGRVRLIHFPPAVNAWLTDWAPRFLVTVIGFLLSVIILVLERNDKYQPWDAVICLLWFTSKICHFPDISTYVPLEELVLFKCILSLSLAILSFTLFTFHFFTSIQRDPAKPRDVRSINPSHKELVQSFKENNEISPNTASKSSPGLPNRPLGSSDNTPNNIVRPSSSQSSESPEIPPIVQPDSTLRKRLAGLSIDNSDNAKLDPMGTEEEPFDKLLKKLGANLQAAKKNVTYQEVTHETHETGWITSGFWSKRCYGSEMGTSVSTGIIASFSASWSRFIPNMKYSGNSASPDPDPDERTANLSPKPMSIVTSLTTVHPKNQKSIEPEQSHTNPTFSGSKALVVRPPRFSPLLS